MTRISVLPIRFSNINTAVMYLHEHKIIIFCHPWTDSALPSLPFCIFYCLIFTNSIDLFAIDIFRFAISYICILSLLMILGIRFSLSWFSSVCDSWLISLPVMSMYRQAFEWPRLLWISSIILTKHKQWSTGFPGDFKIPCSISSSVTEKIQLLSRSYKRLTYFFQSTCICIIIQLYNYIQSCESNLPDIKYLCFSSFVIFPSSKHIWLASLNLDRISSAIFSHFLIASAS